MKRDTQDFSPPPEEFAPLPPEIAPPAPEFTPEGAPQPDAGPPKRRRRLRFLLYAAAMLVYLGLLFRPAGRDFEPSPSPLPPVVETAAPPDAPASAPEIEPAAEPEPEPTPEEPPDKVPELEIEFFYFSHEHHGRVYLRNTGAIRSVEVTVRDKTLDLIAFDYFLSEEEIAAGFYELPMVSTGTLYEEHLAEYNAAGTPLPGTDFVSPAWPELEMIVSLRYEADDGSGEAQITRTLEPAFELGLGVSYWSYDWDEQRKPDSFFVVPWEETDAIRYVINDPDAVTDPTVVSVDFSYEGRHAAPEEYETVLYREEYSLLNADTGEYEPTVGITKQLMLHRPDWMPEQGTVHVVVVQKLASTGELWTREFDLSYP